MNPIKIESIIKREPPTVITLGHKTYQFAPDEHGRHIVEVTDQEHLARLLSIPEGYRLVVDGAPVEPVSKPLDVNVSPVAAVAIPPKVTTLIEVHDQPAADVLLGSDVHPAVLTLDNGDEVQLGDVVQQAFNASGLSLEEWNAQDEDDRHARIDDQLDVLNGVKPESEEGEESDEGEEGAGESSALDREALAKQYAEKFGHRPNGKLSAEKIAAALKEEPAAGA